MLSENMKKAFELIREARALCEHEWKENPPNNHVAGACHSVLNALSYLLVEVKDNVSVDMQDEDYVLSRIFEAFTELAKHYNISVDTALGISGAKKHL